LCTYAEEFFHLVIPILPIRTSACFVLWLMAFVLFCVASAFFRLFRHSLFPHPSRLNMFVLL
ncbi:hypothetical protein, partial [Bacillus altitudinis]|uniref:hypothetical protein n=1 Tax=Bacillus altitudinis TaxID=293387 RepID=UPI0013D9CCC3